MGNQNLDTPSKYCRRYGGVTESPNTVTKRNASHRVTPRSNRGSHWVTPSAWPCGAWTERKCRHSLAFCVCLPFHFGPGLPAFDSGVFPRHSGVFRSINYQTSHIFAPFWPFSLGPILNSFLVVSISRSPLYCAGWLFFPFLHTAFTAAMSRAAPRPAQLVAAS